MTNANRWTSDHLTAPGGTAIYAAQQRERLRQMADEVQALLREYRADLESVRLDGDKPLEHKVRAFLATRPLAKLESHLREAVNAAGKLDAEYNRRYVELPKKRAKRAQEKALEKAQKKGLQAAQDTRAVNTAANLHGISSGLAERPDGNGQQAPAFLDFLKESA
ncbi:hypothetical protein PUR71_33210 [Streptomyces sp. SP17BM10]|uniref:hypothetical protein n=1 Tax=Streptomyces sp. SP17BM10 TaxID=3002530 RepID=UPI002E787C36|nr:hypothetical protein [Streptomyces sp. SP17BM10]MEE1787731.1 hypothetical protein [Streptomyces sp. SP17BM10]